jgi:putative transposase
LPASELCRMHGPGTATFTKLKAEYGGTDLSDAKLLKQLKDENSKVKRLLADPRLDDVVLQGRPSRHR